MMSRRHAALAAVLLFAVSCTGGSSENPGSPAEPERPVGTPPPSMAPRFFQRLACALPSEQLERIRNGYLAERSGDIQIVPQEPNTLGNWFSHSGPWDYLQRVPLLLYGPGHVPAMGPVDRRVTLADVAPTLAELVGFGFEAPDGRPLEEAVPDGPREPPALVVVMVWDSAGRNVLGEHPDAWPTLRDLIPRGVWFENAEVGSSPSISASVHGTLGTGAFPRRNGLVDHWFRLDGRMVFVENTGMKPLLLPTMAERYDEANANAPLVGTVAFDNWHLAMMGQGSYREGGDPDLAVLRRPGRWGLANVSAPFYDFPSYVNTVPRPDPDVLDLEDGEEDGRWFGLDLGADEAFVEKLVWSGWQSRVLDEVIRREGFGADDLPDLLFTNYKQVDEAGHEWTMNSPEMGGIVRATDVALRDLIGVLDRRVGEGRWVLAVLADHGATPKVTVSGGFQIDEGLLAQDILATFDGDGDERDVLQKLRPSQLWIDREELAENGFTLAQVARFLVEYTKGQHLGDPSQLPRNERDDRLFAAAIPSAILEDLSCPRA